MKPQAYMGLSNRLRLKPQSLHVFLPIQNKLDSDMALSVITTVRLATHPMAGPSQRALTPFRSDT